MPGHETKTEPLTVLLGSAVLAAALAISLGAGGQQPLPARPAIDVQRLGPQVGDIVPAFSLPDHTGTLRSLADVLGAKGGLLVFSRSADW
jgi:hypothetical protein